VLFASPAGRRRERNVAARDVAALVAEIAAAKRRLGLSAQARVVSCYEAGRGGFWLDRALRANGTGWWRKAARPPPSRRASWQGWARSPRRARSCSPPSCSAGTFSNRRELAGSVGLTGTPYNSGQSAREQGISKAGNKVS